ncbi:hypothetical protein VSO92_13400 [Myroides pelagicus]|uniref:hypothetical protein n=1 Tax=Myroides pelagicus TaxID=270914 RepID=UPI002DBAA002|nr:hypothetical protein [Myroides pelagicus]MEC4115095.1 hypothetical protein [Myroides pelagicus]
MKKFIKNLLAPLALIAMLAVGAFSVNASEMTDSSVENNIEVVEQASYEGELFIRELDPLTGRYEFTKVNTPSQEDCSVNISSDRCTVTIGTEVHELWGMNPLGGYVELYKL